MITWLLISINKKCAKRRNITRCIRIMMDGVLFSHSYVPSIEPISYFRERDRGYSHSFRVINTRLRHARTHTYTTYYLLIKTDATSRGRVESNGFDAGCDFQSRYFIFRNILRCNV